MNSAAKLEHRASSSQSKHEGESSCALCTRLSQTRDNSQRQLPTDHDYAVSTREYQTDQSSLKTASTAAGPALGKRQKQRQRQKQPHRFAGVDRVTPYQVCPSMSCVVLKFSPAKTGGYVRSWFRALVFFISCWAMVISTGCGSSVAPPPTNAKTL